ncbi:MAG: hypothetical protein HZB55_11890 [Deltaproteobacteria bacterium]|nr:hypothetical protein [Deltaproteobacteria bacterium]
MSRWEPFTPGGYLRLLQQAWWKVLLAAALGGAGAVMGTSLAPAGYRATAVLRPTATGPESAEVTFESVMSPIGIAQGGSAALENLVFLFRSRDLTRRVFRRNDLWPALWGERFDPLRKRISPNLWETLCWGQRVPRSPGDWDAVRAAESRLRVSADVRLGVVTVSFDARSRSDATAIVGDYLEEARNALQSSALARARAKASFLSAELARAIDPITRRRLSELYARQLEEEMMARNREQLGFTVIDSPTAAGRQPDRERRKLILLAALGGLSTAFLYYLEPCPRRQTTPLPPC